MEFNNKFKILMFCSIFVVLTSIVYSISTSNLGNIDIRGQLNLTNTSAIHQINSNVKFNNNNITDVNTINCESRNLSIGGGDNFFFDMTNNRFGISTESPRAHVEILSEGVSKPTSDWYQSSTAGFAVFDESNIATVLGTASNTPSQRPLVFLKRSRNVLSSPNAVQNEDYLGSLISSGYDGGDFQNGGSVTFFVDGTVSLGNVPTKIGFETGGNFSSRSSKFNISTDSVDISTNTVHNDYNVTEVNSIKFSNGAEINGI